jgi:3-keto-5-aminohexanoate cleavage enzyme
LQRDAVIIEVGLNEAAPRALNRSVPYSPEECAEDARRCAAAGAAVVHWHARDPLTGEQRLADARLYGQALDRMRAVDVLAYPSYPVDSLVLQERFGHLWALHDRHGLELAPLDVGSVNSVLWDESARTFLAAEQLLDGAVVTNPLPLTLQALDQIYARGMLPTVTSFDVGITRTVVLLAQAGKLRPPVFLKIFLSGAWAVGPFPSEEALDFHLRQIPQDLAVEWVLVPYALSDPALIERLCRHALARGGGIRVGIGDTPGAYPSPTNAQLIEAAVRWAAEAGRPVASAADVRRRFGLRQRGNDR